MAEGDQAAKNEFARLWYQRIVDWVASRTDHFRMGDYAHEVFAHLLHNDCAVLLRWNGLYEETHEHSFEAFLRTVTRNKVHDLQRSEPPAPTDPVEILDHLAGYASNPRMLVEGQRLMDAFRRCVSGLRAREGKLVELWALGHTGAEIARRLEVTANNVYQIKHMAFSKLRRCLVERLPEYFRHV